MNVAPIAAVILAAGGSTRLGQPKQLVHVDGQPLVRRTAQTAIDAGFSLVVVVVGSAADAVRAAISDLPVRCTANPSWREGVGTSIACGISAVSDNQLAGCLVLPCDQIMLTAATLSTLLHRFRQGDKQVVASRYAETVGPPAIFASALFGQLMELRRDTGAKPILRMSSHTATINFPGGEIDIDTEEDLRKISTIVGKPPRK